MEHAQRDTLYNQGENAWEEVLILILMEHAQRGGKRSRFVRFGRVLILILMEHAQRDRLEVWRPSPIIVLILILMEHAQRASVSSRLQRDLANGLNPYFNGTCSKSEYIIEVKELTDEVLILILMEHAQREAVVLDIIVSGERS